MNAENTDSCSQRDSAERKGYVRAHRSFNRIWKERDSAEPDILGKILDKDNLNRAHFPEQVRKHRGSYETYRSIYARMAELLRNCKYEKQHRKPKWMAVPKDTNVYLETVEITPHAQT